MRREDYVWIDRTTSVLDADDNYTLEPRSNYNRRDESGRLHIEVLDIGGDVHWKIDKDGMHKTFDLDEVPPF